VLFVLGCIGVVFIAAILILVMIAWLAAENAMFGNYTWAEWFAFGSYLSDLSSGVFFAIAGGLCFVGYWIGHVTGMW
jgi:regulator of protease activity HflC (stomatin/prohibitin superfamily)